MRNEIDCTTVENIVRNSISFTHGFEVIENLTENKGLPSNSISHPMPSSAGAETPNIWYG
jgi:hypothetical protein